MAILSTSKNAHILETFGWFDHFNIMSCSVLSIISIIFAISSNHTLLALALSLLPCKFETGLLTQAMDDAPPKG